MTLNLKLTLNITLNLALITHKPTLTTHSNILLVAATKPALGFSISDPHGVIEKVKRRAARAASEGGRMFELLGMETEVDELRNANKEDIQERRKKFSNLLGALEGDERDEDDESCGMSESGSESSLGPFSLRGSMDLTAMGLLDHMLVDLQEIKEMEVEKPPPVAAFFHGRGGKSIATVDIVTEEMKMIALRKVEDDERRRHERGKKEYQDYLKRYEQQMIAVATLPDTSAHVLELQQQQQQQQQQQNEDPGQNQENGIDRGNDGSVPYRGIVATNRDDVSLLRPQVMVQTGWGGALLQAYLTRHQSASLSTTSHAAATAATTSVIATTSNTVTTADVGGMGIHPRAGEDGSVPLSALAATKGTLMPPLSELFYQNVSTSIKGASHDDQSYGLAGVNNNGQPSLQPQPQPPSATANKGGRIVSVATARRKYAEASKSVVMERKRQQAYHEAIHQTVVVLTPDGHDHGDKGIRGPGQGSTGHHPPSHIHHRSDLEKMAEGGEILSTTSGASQGAQQGALGEAKTVEMEMSDTGFAFDYTEKYWRAKDETSGVLQQVYKRHYLPMQLLTLPTVTHP